MNRKNILIAIIIVGIVFSFFWSVSKQETDQVITQATNTKDVLGEKIEDNKMLVTGITAEDNQNTINIAKEEFSCESVEKELREKTKEFMTYHIGRNAIEVLNAISSPSTNTEITTYDFLLGNDTEDSLERLYNSAQFAYTTDEYNIGKIIDLGDHDEVRGTIKCDVQLYETRSSFVEDAFTQETIIRFLEFSVISNRAEITGFTDTLDGTKYSGFN